MLVREQPKLAVSGRHQAVFAAHRATEQHRAITELVSARLQYLLDEAALRQRVGETLHDRRAQRQLARHFANAHRLRRSIQQIEDRKASPEGLTAAHQCSYNRNSVSILIVLIPA